MLLEPGIFQLSLKIQGLLQHEADLYKLPKVEVFKFDGNIKNRKFFWKQVLISIHCRLNLSDAEKLMYLQQSLKDESAKQVIKGLRTNDCYYSETVECLKSWFDCPCTCSLNTCPSYAKGISTTIDGTGKVFRCFHDAPQQHL